MVDHCTSGYIICEIGIKCEIVVQTLFLSIFKQALKSFFGLDKWVGMGVCVDLWLCMCHREYICIESACMPTPPNSLVGTPFQLK